MRKKNQKQMSFMTPQIDHFHAVEMEAISWILDASPIINKLALQDLIKNKKVMKSGANGMTAEQVIRAAIIKQMRGFSYEKLAFHLADSFSYRRFCRIGIMDKGFQKSALCNNIKRLSPETWEGINRILVAYGKSKGTEKGRKVRIDCTVVSSNIHEPTDSSLLFDSVRVLTRILNKVKERCSITFTDHTLRAKRRSLGILNAKRKKQRTSHYMDLLKITRKTVGYAQDAVNKIYQSPCNDLSSLLLSTDLNQHIDLALKVIDQTERRVIGGESVPASEKVVSIFEPHTDIIVKDKRETFYGHKVCLSGGASNLITDCIITEGNPADSSLVEQMLDRQNDIYNRYPLKVAFDGGFASKDNLLSAKQRGIKDVCFSKKRGLEVEDMCRSEWVYKRLRNFRAGIESGISWIKRCFGFTTCTWKTLRSFKSYVWASIVSANLLTLARQEVG